MYFKYLPCIKDIFLDSENRLVKKQWNLMKVPAVKEVTPTAGLTYKWVSDILVCQMTLLKNNNRAEKGVRKGLGGKGEAAAILNKVVKMGPHW